MSSTPAQSVLSANLSPVAVDKMPASQFVALLTFHLLVLAACMAVAADSTSFLPLILAGVVFGLALVQVGFCGHDIDHRQVAVSARASRALSLFCWNFCHGVSAAWWRDKHGRHHRDTHVLGKDPDLYSLFAHAPHEIENASGLKAWPFRQQGWFFWFAILAVRAYYQIMSVRALCMPEGVLRMSLRGRLLEASLIVAHYSVLWGAAWWWLDEYAVLFVLVSYPVSGLYMGLVFCTNHLGLPLQEGDRKGRVWQAAATRNIRTGIFGDYLFGGLNRQIEHHLWPSLSRFRLREYSHQARSICHRASLPYHEVGYLEALREVQAGLDAVVGSERQS